MLTITNYNQQTPTFQARMRMGNASKRLGTYLQDKGINANYAALGTVATTGSAGAAILLKPELITAPAAAKYGILAGMTSTGGVMVPMLSNFKAKETQPDEMTENDANNSARKYEINDSYLGHVFLTKKGIKQYSKILGKIETLQVKADKLISLAHKQRPVGHYHGGSSWVVDRYENVYSDSYIESLLSKATSNKCKIKRLLNDATKQIFIKDGEL